MDYIGATMQSLHDRLQRKHCFFVLILGKGTYGFCLEHREHGNRIMHEFLLGQENIMCDLPRGKTNEYDKCDICSSL